MNKRLAATLMAAMMAFSMAGCSGGGKTDTKAADTQKVQEAEDDTAKVQEAEDDTAKVQEAEAGDEEPEADAHKYMISYYDDVDSEEASNQTTAAMYGTATKLLTIEELGFTEDDGIFEGWRLYREMDNKWYVRNPRGKIGWRELEDGQLPEGYVYQLRKDGDTLTKPAAEGDVRLYAQWGGDEFTVVYHEDGKSAASDMTTTITYGETEQMYYVSDLGFEKEGKEFVGWKLYRELDGKWYARNAEGKGTWASLEDGKLPEGYKYYICKDGRKLTKAATSGIIHAYAQWK